ncbi:endolytic transglycosylase MltG [Paracandidimonas soli]|uniref:Endolytic murein transglycosylase n=1 Tax=Paracandidimonas soli TaxID=1917182 RepID=A0A4R3VDI6_9BURK|nr:endolytic transglycosylase MltG [Paracandidimonas soli]TCV01762.1 UPF0755 protein [Paracandidimonas soli]
MKKITTILLSLLLLLCLGALAVSGLAWYWSRQPVAMPAERVDYIIESGAGVRAVARTMRREGIDIHEDAFVALARVTGLHTRLQAGAYEAVRGDSPMALLERMASGDMLQTRLTFVEGWTYQRMREALRNDPNVRQTLDGVTDAELIGRLGIQADSLEGMFYPDTYVFVPGSTDFDLLRRAHHAQKELLEGLWQERAPDLPLKTPYEALILASIVEKETGHGEDRARVAGVFINRLKARMLLQTDPTVIYGMGEAYQGRIRKRDLTTDTPWNTYTRPGLPPTPIANPGKAALLATLQPETHRYYYFVSRGDGTSEFSQNLAEHNRAVSKYILRRSN